MHLSGSLKAARIRPLRAAKTLGRNHNAEMSEGIGAEIRKARIAIGMTQQELSDRSGLSRTHIGLVEQNVKSPTVKSLFAICRALKVRASLLIARCERKS